MPALLRCEREKTLRDDGPSKRRVKKPFRRQTPAPSITAQRAHKGALFW